MCDATPLSCLPAGRCEAVVGLMVRCLVTKIIPQRTLDIYSELATPLPVFASQLLIFY